MEDGLYIGIDTHKEFHAFCALDERGAVALEGTCAASEAAYEGLCRSLEEAGRPARVAIEGSSSYGRGLSDHMRRRGYDVREAVRPGRRAYSPDGKTDAVDALAAARLAFWDQCAGEPKDNGGPSEDLAYLVAARESAVKEWRSAGNALQGLVAKAPSDVREPFAGLKGEALARAVAESGDMGRPDLLAALRSLARRWTAAFEEAEALAGRMEAIVRAHYAPLLGAKGVGVVTAASLAAIAGGNPGVSATAKSAERATLSRRRRPRFPAGGATALWPPALPRAAAQGALDRGVVEVRGPDLNLQRRGALGVPGRDRPARDLPSAELREPDRHRDVLCAERGQPPRGVRGPHDCPLSGSPSPSAASASRSFMR